MEDALYDYLKSNFTKRIEHEFNLLRDQLKAE